MKLKQLNKIKCPHCGSRETYEVVISSRRSVIRCLNCARDISHCYLSIPEKSLTYSNLLKFKLINLFKR